MVIPFDNEYVRLPERLYARVEPTPVKAPSLLRVNRDLAEQLGIDPDALASPEGVEALAGNRPFEGSEPIALAYAGHQFGNLVPQLGDGRAHLLGEVVDADGVRRDLQLKGSGRTPFSRGGDGRAAVGPVLREYLSSEAMHALGVPTTRALAAVRTGEPIYRETALPGAILLRVARSHLRVGTFEFFAIRRDVEALETLVRHALERHGPAPTGDEPPALTLLDAVVGRQASLVARWLGVGFVHGVMNTDNCAISGETIDYGPAAFLDAYDPGRVFSSIDRGGRYAFARQPSIALWNLARLAETLLPLIDDDADRAARLATERLDTFRERFEAAHGAVLRAKLGLLEERDDDLGLAEDLLDLMAQDRVDYTLAFRRLHEVAADADASPGLVSLFEAAEPIEAWLEAWRARRASEGREPAEQAEAMRRANPAFIPRNHRVEEMIAAAMDGDLAPFERLLSVLARPFDDQPAHAELAEPPGEEQWRYRTFCGT
ncbi:MAG TPA: YdiU family protein [Sandaracinaceae bacterium LLY-WYZ-13_1]|nr:YdiU family protein [Sandaracinaceae bacterium LLY-WYZ-13_1]